LKKTYLSLEEIIQGCKNNNRGAQSELFRRYKDILYYVSLKYCTSEAEAEDNLHDAFLVIFQKISSYKGKGSFEGWMKRITMYKAIDRYKKNKEYPVESQDGLKEDVSAPQEELTINLDTILKAIQQLPNQYRMVFSMFQLDQYSHKEIARTLSISEGTSKSNYHRAKILLRSQLIQQLPKETSTP